MDINDIIADIIGDVAELQDISNPVDGPDVMRITAPELNDILVSHFEGLQNRNETLEEAASAAWTAGMDEHNAHQGLPHDCREVGSAAARRIRELKN